MEGADTVEHLNYDITSQQVWHHKPARVNTSANDTKHDILLKKLIATLKDNI